MVKLDLMRHGEPQGGKRYRGHSIDDPLSDNGWQQMRDAVKHHESWDVIVTSPLMRCQEFADEVAGQYGIAVETIDDLKEIGFGHWEGKSRAIVKAMHVKEYALFYANPEQNPPKNAEKLGVFYRRVLAVIKDIEQRYDGQHVLLVAHAGVIRAILAHVLETPLNTMYKMDIKNACLIDIRLGEPNKVVFR